MSRQHFPTAIVGANPLLRESLSRFLQKSSFNVAAQAARLDDLAPEALPADRAILLIIDACDHPGGACAQIEQFRQAHPLGRIVVLANHCAPADMEQVLRSGANGYFATIATCDDFIKSLELVMGGQTVLPSEGLSSVLLRRAGCASAGGPEAAAPEAPAAANADVPRFSARELYILRCLTEGSSNKVIARECEIAEGTVKVHVKAIMRKIKVQNRTQAAIWALNNRTVVWPCSAERHSEEPPRERSAERPVINITLGTQKIDTSMPEPLYAKASHKKQHSIRCVAEADATSVVRLHTDTPEPSVKQM